MIEIIETDQGFYWTIGDYESPTFDTAEEARFDYLWKELRDLRKIIVNIDKNVAETNRKLNLLRKEKEGGE